MGVMFVAEKKHSLLTVESEKITEVKYNTISINNLSEAEDILNLIDELFNQLNKERDKLFVKIYLNADKESIEYSNDEKRKEVYDSISENIDVKELDDEVKIDLEIIKENKSCTLSVYDLESFSNYISCENVSGEPKLKNIEECIDFSNSNLLFDYVQVFELINDEGNFYTDSFIFTKKGTENVILDSEGLVKNRKILINNRDLYCNFNYKIQTEFIPKDFFIKVQEGIPSNLNNYFNKMLISLSVAFMADYSTFKANSISYKMNGYRNIQKIIDMDSIEDLPFKSKEYFQISDWIYENKSSISERMGIARNVITLFVNGNDLFSINEKILPSIKSSFDIYLKENVDKYVEILNQVALLLNDIEKQSIEVADSFTKDFKNNCFAIITFFTTTILFNTLSTGKIENIFSKDLTTITLGFLLISGIYWIISLFELSFKTKRLKNSYERNKNYYRPILDPEDLERIFNDGNYYDEDEKSIHRIRNLINFLWLSIIMILLAVVVYLGESIVFDSIKNFLNLILYLVSIFS